jgi:hypothetical protein
MEQQQASGKCSLPVAQIAERANPIIEAAKVALFFTLRSKGA